jgi:hypothetical protein
LARLNENKPQRMANGKMTRLKELNFVFIILEDVCHHRLISSRFEVPGF